MIGSNSIARATCAALCSNKPPSAMDARSPRARRRAVLKQVDPKGAQQKHSRADSICKLQHALETSSGTTDRPQTILLSLSSELPSLDLLVQP